MILAVAAILSLDVLAAMALSFVGITTHCLLVARLYCDARSEAGEPLSVPRQGKSRSSEAGPQTEARGQGSGFRVQGLRVDVELQVLNPEPRTLNPADLTHLQQLSEAKCPSRLRLPARGLRKAALFAGALAFLGLSVVTSYSVVETLDVQDRVAVTAHRANTGKAPENTISAIEVAAHCGADFAEIDAQETADGVVVVFHDADLMRVAGVDRKIWDITYDELNEVDVGSWFSPEFRDQRVPTLEEAIEAARDRIKLNIELKFNGHDQKLAERVAGIVRDAGFESQCVISSLDYEGLLEAKRHNPSLKAGFVVFRSIGDVWRLDVDFLSLNADQVDEDLIHRARRNGKAVHAWTVNDRATMVRLVELGVDNVITDDPEALVAILQERAALGDVERLLVAFRNWRSR